MRRTDRRFWRAYRALPIEVRRAARDAYRLLVQNPRHPSLQFKHVGVYRSVRVSLNYRAVATPIEDGLLWYWIGPHGEYEEVIKRRYRPEI